MREVEVRPSGEHAAVRLVECAKEHEGQLTVVALGAGGGVGGVVRRGGVRQGA